MAATWFQCQLKVESCVVSGRIPKNVKVKAVEIEKTP